MTPPYNRQVCRGPDACLGRFLPRQSWIATQLVTEPGNFCLFWIFSKALGIVSGLGLGLGIKKSNCQVTRINLWLKWFRTLHIFYMGCLVKGADLEYTKQIKQLALTRSRHCVPTRQHSVAIQPWPSPLPISAFVHVIKRPPLICRNCIPFCDLDSTLDSLS